MPDQSQDATEAPTDEQVFVLPARPGIGEAEDLLNACRDAGNSAPLAIDGSEVERMSTAVTMVLISAIRSRPDDAPRIAALNASPAFVDAFSTLGFFQDMMKLEFRT